MAMSAWMQRVKLECVTPINGSIMRLLQCDRTGRIRSCTLFWQVMIAIDRLAYPHRARIGRQHPVNNSRSALDLNLID
jgi:hypothetical protein